MEREFNNNLIMDEGPYIYSTDTVRRRMALLIVSLLPMLVASTAILGKRVLAVVFVSVICCMAFQAVLDLIMRRRPFFDDFTCAVTGIVIACGLPVNVKLWIVVVADAVAILAVKGLIHGRGRNLINPAATGLLVVYAGLFNFLELWPVPSIGDPDIPADVTVIASAADILQGAEGLMPINWELFLGFCPGPIGHVCNIALLAGGIFLIFKRVIGWVIPVSVLITCAVLSVPAGVNIITMLCSGGTMFIAFYMASDPVTSPMKNRAQAVYGVILGIIFMVFRLGTDINYGGYIAIIVMNILGLGIDKFFAFEMYKGIRKRRV